MDYKMGKLKTFPFHKIKIYPYLVSLNVNYNT